MRGPSPEPCCVPTTRQVLSIYPSTIRRRILRHLYQTPMQQCYLFADCKQKFLDALMAAARVELFMPQVPKTPKPKPGLGFLSFSV